MMTTVSRLLVAIALLPGACSFSAPPEQVILDMREAVCEQRTMAAAQPFVTLASRPLLTQAEMAIKQGAQMKGVRIDDLIAQGCAGKPEIQGVIEVNPERYIVSYVDELGEAKKAAVVSEDGAWRMDMTTKVPVL
jgi:hypothetical protein